MLFNSFPFAIFLPIAFLIYWWLWHRPLWARNGFLILASYLFYGWWDYRFLGLIILSSAADYFVGLRLAGARGRRERRFLLWASLSVNLGALGVFKYFDFFIDSFAQMLAALGFSPNLPSLRLILPVGISFYTFQTLSYTIDVYSRRIAPTRDWIAFFAYVSFFPQLVAGPIERARHLLPQFLEKRPFDADGAADGLRRILWGLFKKVVIADNLARYVDAVYGNAGDCTGLALFLGTLYFAIQIYCDFSGYSDMAIGTARLFGFDLMENFTRPYFSRDMGEFWRRWHISLSSWFRDYVYIPLGGSRMPGRAGHIRNLMITFGVSGLWHGASWTFVTWGLLHGLFLIPPVLTGGYKRHDGVVAEGRMLPTLLETREMAATFALGMVAWIFFRADSLGQALLCLRRLATTTWLSIPDLPAPVGGDLADGLGYVAVLLALDWISRERPHPLAVAHLPRRIRHGLYYALILSIFLFAETGHVPFIYFQF